jgi:large subunit ribosomal protein L7/L12
MVIALAVLSVVAVLLGVGLVWVLRSRTPEATPPATTTTPPPRVAGSLDDVRQLARAGRKLEAIRLFRQLTGQGLAEAKAAVDQLAGRSSPAPRKTGIILREVRDADIEQQIRCGDLLNAVALYREKNGVGLQEARTAVERWRDRLQAS